MNAIYKKWTPDDKKTMNAIVAINGLNKGVKITANAFGVSEAAVRSQYNLTNNYIKS